MSPDDPRCGAAAAFPSHPLLLSWSSGKDSLWALRVLRAAGCDVRGLITSCNGESERVAMHGVRRELLELQAEAVGLPLTIVDLPFPCTDEDYEQRMEAVLVLARDDGARGVAFGDLFLQDVREFREKQLAPLDLEPCFPIWGLDTRQLALDMVDAGVRAVLTCVDPRQCPRELAGTEYGAELFAALPDSADPCGEKGEFHTFVYDGPGFSHPVEIHRGEVVERGGFVFADLLTSAVSS